MDILLTHGYFLGEDEAERAIMRPYPPLGLLYLSSHLKAKGFAVEVFDTTFSSPADQQARIKEARPAVLGIYTNLITRPGVLAAIAAGRQAGASVILGGPEAVNYPAEYLSHGADIIVAGEGEATLAELLPHLSRHGLTGLEAIDGIIFNAGDGLIRTSPRALLDSLDDQPFPDRAAIDMGSYLEAWRRHHGAGSVSLITARGCPFTCTWCSHSVFGFSYRHRSPENVADELAHIRETLGPERVWYADDVFTLNKRWIRQFRDVLAGRGLHFPFETISREDRLDEATIEALADLGCRRLWVGAESGSQRILDAMDRRTDAVRMRRMIERLTDHGIETGTFIMLGYDGEEWADLDLTVAHLKAATPDSVLTTVSYPIKGTPYYESVGDRLTIPGDWASASDRDIRIAGRRSATFYHHTARWIQSETALSRAWRQRAIPGAARAWIRAKLARLAMYRTRHQLEEG